MTTLDVITPIQDATSRAIRQALQTLVPTLVVLAGGTASGIDELAVAYLAGVTILVSLAKSLTGLKVPAGAPLWAHLAERAVTAAAGAFLGFVTAGGSNIATSIPWQATLTGSLGAAVLAVVMYFSNPPVSAGQVVPGELVEPEGPTFVAGEQLPRRERSDGGQD